MEKRSVVRMAKMTLAICLVALCAFFSILESADCASIEALIRDTEEKASETRDSIMLLNAQIAQAGTPEFLSWSSGILKVEVKKIEPEKNYFVDEAAYE